MQQLLKVIYIAVTESDLHSRYIKDLFKQCLYNQRFISFSFARLHVLSSIIKTIEKERER